MAENEGIRLIMGKLYAKASLSQDELRRCRGTSISWKTPRSRRVRLTTHPARRAATTPATTPPYKKSSASSIASDDRRSEQ